MRILVATAVVPERDAVAKAFAGPARPCVLPGAALLSLADDAADDPPAGMRTDAPPAGRTAPAARWDLLAAGVGPASAAAGTGAALTAAALAGDPYGLVVSAGIGGGFAPAAPPGCLVVADAITAADLGAETPDGFLPVTALGFGTTTHAVPASLVAAAAAALPAVVGTVLTVSTATGTASRAAELRGRHPGAVAEAMEGFGVAEAAAAHGVPALEVRAVSNPVGPRDRAAWRIKEALAALTEAFGKLRPVLESWREHEHHADHPDRCSRARAG
ncbi:Futalosine hydrolase [Streptomyces sulfonofaciens]|uniref:Futalosine hydrolase n=1 Tax=Streptomyces sulfonofaciens TaxID=68272 RepID=A0A919KR31_9ACTN|nr:futalosine hydrolase [Streptomyces sulfonofaciens]GHH69087.1 Futalosine hydrolase [Streptomyces sulfonofaciens]